MQATIETRARWRVAARSGKTTLGDLTAAGQSVLIEVARMPRPAQLICQSQLGTKVPARMSIRTLAELLIAASA